MIRTIRMTISTAAVAALVTSCSMLGGGSAGDNTGRPFSEAQLKALETKACTSSSLGITPYQMDNGMAAYAGTLHITGEQVATANMTASSVVAPLPVIEFRNGRRIMRALIDTSSPSGWITPEAARRLKLQLIGDPQLIDTKPSHLVDPSICLMGIVPELQIDHTVVSKVPMFLRAVTGSLGALGRNLQPPADFVIGSDFLRAFGHVQLSFANRFALFYASGGYEPETSNLVGTATLFIEGGAIAVGGEMDNEPSHFILDVAGDYTVAVPARESPPEIMHLAVGDLVVRHARAVSGASLGLGEIKHPRIGRRALEHFKVTLDFQNRKVFFERPQ